jgi:hypothetical protein
MIEFCEFGNSTNLFPRSVPWSNTDEDYPNVIYILEQLYAQMMGWC